MARLLDLPRRAVVLAEDETYLNLLPHLRASWTLRGARPQVLTPPDNHGSDQYFGPIDRVHVYPYHSSQDRVRRSRVYE